MQRFWIVSSIVSSTTSEPIQNIHQDARSQEFCKRSRSIYTQCKRGGGRDTAHKSGSEGLIFWIVKTGGNDPEHENHLMLCAANTTSTERSPVICQINQVK
jgi:hypothetical protein